MSEKVRSVQSGIFKNIVLCDQQSKNSRTLVYDDVKQRKAESHHIVEAETRECFIIIVFKNLCLDN